MLFILIFKSERTSDRTIRRREQKFIKNEFFFCFFVFRERQKSRSLIKGDVPHHHLELRRRSNEFSGKQQVKGHAEALASRAVTTSTNQSCDEAQLLESKPLHGAATPAAATREEPGSSGGAEEPGAEAVSATP